MGYMTSAERPEGPEDGCRTTTGETRPGASPRASGAAVRPGAGPRQINDPDPRIRMAVESDSPTKCEMPGERVTGHFDGVC